MQYIHLSIKRYDMLAYEIPLTYLRSLYNNTRKNISLLYRLRVFSVFSRLKINEMNNVFDRYMR